MIRRLRTWWKQVRCDHSATIGGSPVYSQICALMDGKMTLEEYRCAPVVPTWEGRCLRCDKRFVRW